MKLLLYKLLALAAFATALGLGIITLHFTLARAEITITAREKGETRESEIILPITLSENALETSDEKKDDVKRLREQVLKNGATNEHIGTIHTLSIALEHTVIPEGPGTEIPDYATGTVTLISELTFAQSLVSKTRLLTPDGVLFRITAPVIVPARGTVDVTVKADKIGKEGNIAPTTFTIPGLSLERQRRLYGKSSEKFEGGVRLVRTLTEADFERGKREALEKIIEEAIVQFNKNGIAMTRARILLSDVIIESDDEVGEEKEELTLLVKAEAYGLDFDEEFVKEMAKTRFAADVPDERTVLGLNEESFTYTIQEINPDLGEARIMTMIEGFTTLNTNKDIIDPKELAGLSAKEIQTKLLQNEAIDGVEVRFSPFWVTRAPRIAEKITVTIQK